MPGSREISEADVQRFLLDVEAAYAADEVLQTNEPDGSFANRVTTDEWQLTDRYRRDDEPAGIVVGRSEVARVGGATLWAVAYRAEVKDPARAERVLDFYTQGIRRHTDPLFPVCGLGSLEIDGLRYYYDSAFGGQLTLANFSVRERIRPVIGEGLGPLLLLATKTGGWLR